MARIISRNPLLLARQSLANIGDVLYMVGIISVAKQHISVSPEQAGITHFLNEIAEAGYSATKGLFRIKWNEPVDYNLIQK